MLSLIHICLGVAKAAEIDFVQEVYATAADVYKRQASRSWVSTASMVSSVWPRLTS